MGKTPEDRIKELERHAGCITLKMLMLIPFFLLIMLGTLGLSDYLGVNVLWTIIPGYIWFFVVAFRVAKEADDYLNGPQRKD